MSTDYAFSDPAGDEARRMQEEQLAHVEEGEEPHDVVVEDVHAEKYRRLFQKINYRWRPEDKNTLIQLRAAADRVIMDTFASQMVILDVLYNEARTPLYVRGRAVRDEHDRPMWETDENGQILEDWTRVGIPDLEKALLNLSRVKIETSQRVADLFLEAVFAKHIYNDKWHEDYEGAVEGTQGDRTARAQRLAKEEKYAAYFRYYVYYRADALNKEISQLARLLERMLDWRSRRG